MTRQAGLATPSPPNDGFGSDPAAAACRMRRLIVGVLLLAGLIAHALLWW
jgi:hypothetical protein